MALFGPPSIEKLKARNNLRGIAKATTYPDAEIRAAALLALGESRQAEVLPLLVRGVQDPEPEVRLAAVQGIGLLGVAQGQAELASVLHGDDLRLHAAALHAMGQIKAAAAVPVLVEALERKEAPIRAAALDSLRQIAETTEYTQRTNMIPAFVPLLTHRRSDVRRIAAHALQRFDWMPDESPAGASFLILCDEISASVMFGAMAIEPLISTLHDERPDARDAARRALVTIGSDAVAPLVAALDTDNPVAQLAIVETLRSLGDKAIPALLDGLQAPQPIVQQRSLELLSMLDDPQVRVILLRYLNDADLKLAQLAMDGLVRQGPEVVPSLVQALKQPDVQLRERAAEVLAHLNWQPKPDYTGAVYAITRNDWATCVQLGAVAVPPLLEALSHWDSEVRRAAALTLVQIGAPALAGLMSTLQSDTAHARASAAWALGKLHANPAASALAHLLNDPDQHVQETAIGALIRVTTPPDIFVAALANPNLLVRKTAAWALGHHRYAPAVPALIEALHDPAPDMRDTAARALGEIGDPHAIQPLLTLIDDPDPAVRATIVEVTRYLHRQSEKAAASA